MLILADTNLHLRLVEPGHHHHAHAVNAITHLESRGHDLLIFPQVIYEFWAACTSPPPPVANGLGLSVGRTFQYVIKTLRDFDLVHDVPDVFHEWYRLVAHHGITGRDIHDAHLVAAMNVHAVTHILTFNGPDFARYSGIAVIDPLTVTAASNP